jgi:AntA/AntB antirepressor
VVGREPCVDFTNILIKKTVGFGERDVQDFAITTEFAKHIAMMARTLNGHKYRNYFLELEARTQISLPVIPSSQPLTVAKIAFETYHSVLSLIGIVGNEAAISANHATFKVSGVNLLADLNMLQLPAPMQSKLLTPTEVGLEFNMSAVKANDWLLEKGLQTFRRDHKDRKVWDLTEEGKKYARLLDSGKKHSDGSPVQQIKWLSSVFELASKKVA